MTVSSTAAVQKAVLDRLATDANLIAILGSNRIHDSVPRDVVFPFVTLGPIETNSWNTQDQIGREHIVTINSWSRYCGHNETHKIVGAIDQSLDRAELSLIDHSLVNCAVVFWHSILEPDGETFHGIVRLRIVTEPNS